MYAVNSSIPKTLVRYLISYAASSTSDTISGILKDILETPVSPELLPHKNDQITQVTEDLVGPYVLHDFFLYYFMRLGFPPEKIFLLARIAFTGTYDDETIEKWLTVFLKRFFAQQFKRSCLPDGPKVGSVTLSPRADWRMPSDASVKIWLDRHKAN
jgi:NAD+ synthase (glutamine-hydrolysing)